MSVRERAKCGFEWLVRHLGQRGPHHVLPAPFPTPFLSLPFHPVFILLFPGFATSEGMLANIEMVSDPATVEGVRSGNRRRGRA